MPGYQSERYRKPGPLRDDRGQRHTLDRHPEAKHEKQVQRQIGEVDENDLDHRQAHLLAPENAPQKHHVRQRRRHGQNADAHIVPHQRFDGLTGGQQRVGNHMHGRCGDDKDDAKAQGEDQTADKVALDLPQIAPPLRLGDQPGRAHAQEAKPEIDEIEDQAAKRDAANKAGIIKPPHHRGVGRADKREGHIGDNDRP